MIIPVCQIFTRYSAILVANVQRCDATYWRLPRNYVHRCTSIEILRHNMKYVGIMLLFHFVSLSLYVLTRLDYFSWIQYAVIDAQRPLKAVQKAAKIAQRSLLFHCHQLPKKRPWAEDAAEFGKEEVAGEAPSRVVCTAAGKLCHPFIESQKSCLINFHKLGCATMVSFNFKIIYVYDFFRHFLSPQLLWWCLIPSISEVTGARRMVWSWLTLIPTKGTMKRRPLKPKGGSFWKGSLERRKNTFFPRGMLPLQSTHTVTYYCNWMYFGGYDRIKAWFEKMVCKELWPSHERCFHSIHHEQHVFLVYVVRHGETKS